MFLIKSSCIKDKNFQNSTQRWLIPISQNIEKQAQIYEKLPDSGKGWLQCHQALESPTIKIVLNKRLDIKKRTSQSLETLADFYRKEKIYF